MLKSSTPTSLCELTEKKDKNIGMVFGGFNRSYKFVCQNKRIMILQRPIILTLKEINHFAFLLWKIGMGWNCTWVGIALDKQN